MSEQIPPVHPSEGEAPNREISVEQAVSDLPQQVEVEERRPMSRAERMITRQNKATYGAIGSLGIKRAREISAELNDQLIADNVRRQAKNR